MRKEKFKKYLTKKYIAPVVLLLKQGTAPRDIAFGIAGAAVLGLFPVLGSTTLLITGFALLFRLNLPLVQLINFSVYPLQIILLIPFMKLGEILFGFEKLNYNLDEITSMIADSIPNAIAALWNVTIQAIAAWSLIAPLIGLLLFYSLYSVLRRIK
jgi:uncharacterized protein (DUF2062 family)